MHAKLEISDYIIYMFNDEIHMVRNVRYVVYVVYHLPTLSEW